MAGINSMQYSKLKEKFGKYSSWAIWSNISGKGIKVSDAIADLSVFENEAELLPKLNSDYVLIGLNPAKRDDDKEDPWHNFHSRYRYQKDSKLKYAVEGTELEGSYITDLVKHIEETQEMLNIY